MRADDNGIVMSKREVECMLQYAVARSDHREHMNGLHFDPAVGCVVATDGHALIRANSLAPKEGAKPFTAPREVLERAAKLANTSTHELLVRCDHDSEDGPEISIDLIDTAEPKRRRFATVFDSPVERDFPPVEQVVPALSEVSNQAATHVDPKFYKRLGDMTKAGIEGIECHGQKGDELGPVLYTAKGVGTTYTIVVMPKRKS
jgi:hypothetical protein